MMTAACLWMVACGGSSASPPGSGAGGAGAAARPCVPGKSVSADLAATYFPYQAGARWMFEGHGATAGLTSIDQTFLEERAITGTMSFGADTTLVLWNSNLDEGPASAMKEFVQVTAQGLVNHGTDPVLSFSATTLAFPPPVYTEVPFPIDLCKSFVTFDVPTGDVGYDIDGDGKNDMAAVHATTAISLEDVTVPIGSFPGALRVQRDIVYTVVHSKSKTPVTSAQTQVDWYAPGIGPIKRTTSDDRRSYEFDLVAYSVGGVSRGFMPPTPLARGLSQNLPAFESGHASSAIGFDGTNFLAVAPLSPSVSGPGGLQGYVIAPDGTTVVSAPLLHASESPGVPAIAFDGTRYLVAFFDSNQRVEVVVVSPAAENLAGPMVVSKDPPIDNPALKPAYADMGSYPSVVATKAGFLVSYSKTMLVSTSLPPVTSLWLAPVDVGGNATAHVAPFPGTTQGPAKLATDGTTVLAVWTQQSEKSGLSVAMYGARFDSTGHLTDGAPFLIASVQNDNDAIEDLQVIFDGTQFVVLYGLSASGPLTVRVSRISLDGTLTDGPASAGGVTVAGPSAVAGGPTLSRFGAGSVIVWGTHRGTSPRYGIAATRYTVDGQFLDMPLTTGGVLIEGPLARMSLADDPNPAIAWGSDRALMIWSTGGGDGSGGYDLGLAFPW